MADKQYGWLDRETAERLLRGESLDNAVDAADRDDAERLAKTLGALSVEPPMSSAELPGEAAALAAFRKAHANRGPATAGHTHPAPGATPTADTPSPGAASAHAPSPADSGHTSSAAPSAPASPTTASGHTQPTDPVGHASPAADFGRALSGAAPGDALSGSPSTDAGLIRIGVAGHRAPRTRRRRTVRFGVAAVVAFGMVGGVVAAAATGVLPRPFGEDEPRPGASVSAAVTPDRPLVSPSPDGAAEDEPRPEGSVGASPDQGTPRTDAGGAPSADPDGHGRTGGFGSWWDGAPSACRDIRDGKRLSTDRRRALEGLAGGSTRVWKYCKDVLKTSDGQAGREDDRKDSDKDQDGPGGDDESHHGAPGGNGNGHGRGNDHHQNGGLSTPSPSPSDDTAIQPKRAAAVPEPSPNPSYSAL
ncbi:hypothetical protein [Streptomyces sp. WM6386]|uniref:hypothetical protein n=1 Tax=Streptomyces sp. WM6386 TaxID=1415558 RepID=UPI00069765EE|nr:hypothetical protein [Streptomyces sp. WM6386]